MEILSNIDITDKIRSINPETNKWNSYLYCENVGKKGRIYGKTKHFDTDYLQYIESIGDIPAHVSQKQLNTILFDQLDKSRLIEGSFTGYKQNETIYSSIEASAPMEIESKYLISCEGASSTVGRELSTSYENQGKQMKIVNISFKSPELTSLLADKQSMLYFIYHYNHISVLINYGSSEHTYSLQYPFDEHFEPFESFDEPKISKIIEDITNSYIKFEIISITKWVCANRVANIWQKSSVALCGDAAHQFAPSGGFGLNTGIADAFCLSWVIKSSLEDRNYFSLYEKERRSFSRVFT